MGIIYPVPHVLMLGKGSVLLDIFDASGNPSGFQHLGNATKFEIELKDDIAELFQSLNKSVTQIGSALKKRQGKISITGTDFSSVHGAITQMSSGKTSLATTATTFTSEVLITAAQAPNAIGRYFQALHFNTDGVGTPPVLTSNAVVLTAGTDYVLVDAIKSIYYIPAASTISSHAVTATYNTLVGSQDQVAAATVPFQQGHLKFVPDPVDGQKIMADLWKCNLHPQGQFGLISDDYANWSLDGEILDNTALTPNAPFYQLTYF
jgi:hypothetical protein